MRKLINDLINIVKSSYTGFLLRSFFCATPNEGGVICYGFKLNPEKIEKINETGELWLNQLTNGDAMQPIIIKLSKEEALTLSEEAKAKI